MQVDGPPATNCTDNSRIFSFPAVLQPSNDWQLLVFQEMVPRSGIAKQNC
jgi:hypothetical protein